VSCYRCCNPLLLKALDFDGGTSQDKFAKMTTETSIHSFNWKDQVLTNRLMIGHTSLTHSHLLSKEPPLMCTYCSTLLTVEHILTNCSHYQSSRQKYYQYFYLSNIFQVVPKKSLISFIKEINFYHQF